MRTPTTVPYAQISVRLVPISEVSKRHRHDGGAALRSARLGHPLDHLVAAVGQFPDHALQAVRKRLDHGAEVPKHRVLLWSLVPFVRRKDL